MSFKQAFLRLKPTKPPAGWMRLSEVAADMGVLRIETACRKLTVMIKAGLVEKKRIVLWDEHGCAAPCSIYRLVKK